MLEEAERELDAQNAARGFVDYALGNVSGANLVGDYVAVEVALHVHVDAGLKSFAGCGWGVADGVIDEFANCTPIGDDKAVEAPLLAQNFGEREGVGRGGNAVDGVEGAHQRG